jgi:RNA polymerase sigma-70 factor (ECF subfamily)
MKTVLSTDTIWAHLSMDLRQFIRRRVSDDHAADDLLQETFLRIHRNVGTLRDSDRLAAWVYQIARNVIRDHHRKAANSMMALGEADPADANPTDKCDHQPSQLPCGGAEWLGQMISTLPPGYREAVRWAEMERLSQQEVAHKFGITLSGAKSRIQRGRRLLRQALEECCIFQLDHAGRPMDCSVRPGQKACQSCGS